MPIFDELDDGNMSRTTEPLLYPNELYLRNHPTTYSLIQHILEKSDKIR